MKNPEFYITAPRFKDNGEEVKHNRSDNYIRFNYGPKRRMKRSDIAALCFTAFAVLFFIYCAIYVITLCNSGVIIIR